MNNQTQNIKSFEDACIVLNKQPESLLPAGLQPCDIAFIKLRIIAEALNEGWQPDWSNYREYKYYPWFNMDNGFSFYVYVYNSANSNVGSRLCFKSSDLAEYAGKTFTDLYKDMLTF